MIKYRETAISDLRVGDTVLIGGTERTVGKCDVKKGFAGYTLWGDPHHQTQGRVPVRLYPRFFRGTFVGWFTQN